MDITDPFVLPSGVELIPVAELDDAIRSRIDASEGDYAIARPGGRVSAKLVDRTTATLLRRFATPITIVDAVIDTSKELDEDPEKLLEAAHPILVQLISAGLLVTTDKARAATLEPRHRVGETVAGRLIRSCIHVIDDTELYVVSDDGAGQSVLKIGRTDALRPLGDLEREARALERIAGGFAPRLRDSGRLDGRAFIVMELRQGVLLSRAANELRHSAVGGRRALADLACSVADAYAKLHSCGVVHGDVHEGNVLVDRDGRITLVDFGLARILDDDLSATAGRGGISFYFEPEYAGSILAGNPHPPATDRSDQYSLAAMLYSTLTGARYLDFDMEERRAFEQITAEPMLPFSHWGEAPWPEVERVLAQALSKHPGDRFDSVLDFAAELCRASNAGSKVASVVSRKTVAARSRRITPANELLERLRAAELADGEAPLPAPTASVSLGASGVALGLYRLALLRNDSALLSNADRWSERAIAESRRNRGFYDGVDLTPGTFGRRSLYCGASGPYVVRALIANAMGDFQTLSDSLRSLSRLPNDAGPALDLLLGVPGALLGLSLVLEAIPEEAQVDLSPLVRAGDRCATRIGRALNALRPINDEYTFANLGMAHGWGGALYALMRWHQASGKRLASSIRTRLDQLADLAEPVGRGLHWPWRDVRRVEASTHGYMAGWCNGSAGFVHLYLTAHEVFGDPRHREIAESAAWDAWEDDETTVFDLCCGSAGRGYALLALHRATGDDVWLRRARRLADDAMDAVAKLEAPSPALYKGALGAVLLLAEVDEPHLARMPLFENENWPRRTSNVVRRGR